MLGIYFRSLDKIIQKYKLMLEVIEYLHNNFMNKYLYLLYIQQSFDNSYVKGTMSREKNLFRIKLVIL